MTMIAIREYPTISHGELPSGFPADHEQLASSGFLIPSRCLVGTYGVTFDEALTGPGDFIVGDSIKLLDQSGVIPVLVKSHDQCKYRIIFDEVDIGAGSLDLKIAKSITLMSEFGIIVYARILHNRNELSGHLFLLLEERIAPLIDYTILSQTDSFVVAT